MANDNILDSAGMFMAETYEMKHCVELILKSIVVLFQWKDFESSDMDDLFISIVSLCLYLKSKLC
jgi:hypothetical protein